MKVSGSEKSDQSLDDSDASSKSNDSWSLGSNESYLDNIKYSRRENLKKHSEKCLRLDQYIKSNFNYESLRSRLTSHNNKKFSKNKIKEKIN